MQSTDSGIQFNDLLLKAQIAPSKLLVLRHRPKEPALRRVLPWLANENHDLFNAYQQTQGPNVEKAVLSATHVAAFIGHQAGKALFVGLYKVGKATPLTQSQYWKVPANAALRDFGMLGISPERTSCLWFDLVPEPFLSQWKGKLVVHWPGKELSWWRWAERNAIPVHSILEESLLDRAMPPWNKLVLTWKELAVLPQTWQDALTHWRGIYFILDVSDGKGYVGSAYGKDNLLGRWRNYAKSGHGGNKLLLARKPDNLRFSILQRVSPDLEAAEVHALEASWKDRLHTRVLGLNEN